MKALVFHGPYDLRYETAPDPQIQDSRDAIVKMKQCGICGSDLHFFHGSMPTPRPVFGIGHEAIGEVVEKGAGVSTLRVGDLVMLSGSTGCGSCSPCSMGQVKRCENKKMDVYGIGRSLEGCQAQGIRVPAADSNAARIPEGISDDQAILLTDNLPTAYGACLDAGIEAGKTVAVIGLGPIGLMALEISFAMGASAVYGIDLVAERRNLAQTLGATPATADAAVEIVTAGTSGKLVDCVIDAAGTDLSMALALKIVGIGGSVAVLGVNMSMDFRIPFEAFLNGVRISGNFLTEIAKYWPALVPLLQRKALRPERFITYRAPLAAGPETYQRFADRAGGILKPILTCS